jgi:hypothetical protein
MKNQKFKIKWWKYSGLFLAATGILHTAGLLLMGKDLLLWTKDAIENSTFDNQFFLMLVFWLNASGIVLIIFGHTLHYYISKEQKPAPRFVGYYLLGLAIIGCIVAPVSGFLLLIPQALIILFAKQSNNNINS